MDGKGKKAASVSPLTYLERFRHHVVKNVSQFLQRKVVSEGAHLNMETERREAVKSKAKRFKSHWDSYNVESVRHHQPAINVRPSIEW